VKERVRGGNLMRARRIIGGRDRDVRSRASVVGVRGSSPKTEGQGQCGPSELL